MEIIWTNTAYQSLDENIDYLKKDWSIKEIEEFFDIVDEKVILLKSHPEIGTIYEIKPSHRKLVITKHITLFYEVEEPKIYLHLFWLNFKNPEKLQMFFS